MRSTPLAVALLLALAGGASAATDPQALPHAAKTDAAQVRSLYIVRFDEPPVAAFRGDADRFPKLAGLKATSPAVTGERKLDMNSAATKAYRGALTQLRETRLASAAVAFGRPLEPLFVYDVALNGVALELTAAEAAALTRHEGVAAVEKERVHRMHTDAGPRWIGADAIWTAAAPEGNRGEGVIVGVIDSGINRTHPSFAGTGPNDGFVHANPAGAFLGQCATNAALCNGKLVGIHDFTVCTGVHNSSECDDREANDGSDVDGHGSHVAGTAVGNTLTASFDLGSGATTRTLSGVAPHANLATYKACEEEETCRGTWLVAAVNQATADGVDVINYSIGGAPYSPWDDGIALAMLAAREAGITVVTSAGNDGPGPETVSSSGNAPWVLAVANATHDRIIANRLESLSGGATPPPSGGVLVGAGATAGVGPVPIVYAGNFGSALCATGDRVDDLPPSTATNPWATPVFSGQIVVCDRGIYARTIKGLNVKNAGGAGMVLVNGAADGELVVADEHELPATHLGFTAGTALKTWLASGTGHSGRLGGATIASLPSNGNVLNVSSSRGPVEPFGLMKPNLTAPGTDIVAAAGSGNDFAFLSGTSMASPHVAGAAALLRGAHPSWGPDEITTALTTTARPVVKDYDGSPAGIFDQGAGVVDLALALDSGLSFPVTRAQFLSADIGNMSVSTELNLPSLVDPLCVETCTFTRTVKALAAGTWRAAASLPGATVSVSPSEFTLAANATQLVSVTVDVPVARLGDTLEGGVTFTRDGGGASAARLPLAVVVSPGVAPSLVQIDSAGESGFEDIAVSELVGLQDARFAGTRLVAPTRATLTLRQDTTSDDPYNGFLPIDAGEKWILLTVQEDGPARVLADVTSATADDIDLYVGFDANGDGYPQEEELVCRSATASATERCIDDPIQAQAGDRFWVLPQNWRVPGDTTSPITTDAVQLSAAVVSLVPHNGELVATGPGHSETNQDFDIRAAWNVPTLLPGDTRWGAVLMAAEPGQPAGAGNILIELRRAASGASSPQVLAPGATRTLSLAAGKAQDRLYIDVPPNATGLTATTAGSGEIDLYVANAGTPSSPAIAAAPARGAAAGTSIHAGAAETLTLTGAALTPGRWYVTPVNAGATPATFTLKVDLAYGSARPQPAFGPYFNPARSGAGLFLFPSGDAWGLAWYTYLQDGSPTWYLGVLTAPTANQGVWTVDLQRQAWNGEASNGTKVGQAQLAFTDATHFTFSWNLDGESGSEPMSFIDGGDCPSLDGSVAPLSGLWFSPAQSGYGYSITAYPGLESNGAYFYDDLGLPRWAIGNRVPFEGGERTMALVQQNGFCPLCTWAAPTSVEIGTLTRTYTDAANGRIAVDLELAAPATGTWSVDLPVTRVSNALTCQ
ncbi:S8 family serine peptidase [Chiayiivirga flava]|uniref:Subtilisin family serine protease n=1 Tax=Chiayiivirga flava TaxID=659595 RepID=A0A7W8D5L2_9GAMM|nr:S8 family serine peptidase [Chiayiivirga flava]MBB5208331.1 subtilisin family serine protease [Chiayiivirga flava]